MKVQITIRDVPSGVRDELAARAARRGQSMQEYLRAELVSMTEKPSMDELLERIRLRKAASGTRIAAASILDARDRDRR